MGRPCTIDPMDRLRDRTCLVTGSTGMAAAAARRLAGEGAAVFIVSRTADHARALADAISADGGQAAWAAADVAVESEVDVAVAAAVERFGRIDGLFAAAGGSGRRFGDGPIHEVTAEGWDKTIELNLRSQALTCRAVVRQMLAQDLNGSGHTGIDPVDGQCHGDRSCARVLRDPRLRGGQGRDERPDDDHGGRLCARPDPGQRRGARADRHADGAAGRRRCRDPRLRRPEAAAWPAS